MGSITPPSMSSASTIASRPPEHGQRDRQGMVRRMASGSNTTEFDQIRSNGIVTPPLRYCDAIAEPSLSFNFSIADEAYPLPGRSSR